MSSGRESGQEEAAGQSPEKFYAYYAERSQQPDVLANIESIYATIIAHREATGSPTDGLSVLDIGCNAGTQCIYWAERGHRVHGIDIGSDFIDLANDRAAAKGLTIDFRAGTAAALPWPDNSFDVCLMPELLEHVANWQVCLDEAIRTVRKGGSLFISTTNRLCPVQQEFELPLYSWYPARLKRWCERRATSTHPQWVNHARYPAVNWFSYYSLRDYLALRGFDSAGRFQLLRADSVSGWKARLGHWLRRSPVLGFLGQMVTPYTIVVATRR